MREQATRFGDSIVVFIASLSLYVWTLAPGPVWGDSAGLALLVHAKWLAMGTAGDHPLFVLLGMAFAQLPGDLARNVNLASAASAAAAVVLVQLVASRLAGSAFAGFAAAAALAVSHAFWQHAVMAEVYTLNAAFVALLILLLLRWRDRGMPAGGLVVATAVFALGLTNHLVLASLLPAMVVFVLTSRRPDRATLLTMAGVLAALLLGVLLVPPARQALLKIWFGPPPISHYFLPPANVRDLPREIAFYGIYLFYQFPLVGLALGILGVRSLLRRDRGAALFLLLALGANAFVFVKTTEWASPSTKYVFYISDYVVFAVFVGLGAADVASRLGRRVVLTGLLACPLLLYGLLPPTLSRLGVRVVTGARQRAFRNDTDFFLNPSRRGDDSPRRFAEAAFAEVPRGSLIVADYTPYVVLRYMQQVEGRREDVGLAASDGLGALLDLAFLPPRIAAGQPVYLAGKDPRYYNISSLPRGFTLIPAGPLYRAVSLPQASRPSQEEPF